MVKLNTRPYFDPFFSVKSKIPQDLLDNSLSCNFLKISNVKKLWYEIKSRANYYMVMILKNLSDFGMDFYDSALAVV